MSREELLEAAALDAFGLLEEYEASLYTRSFHHAPATVQDEVVRIQAEWATDETFLAADEPDPVLRRRTLEAVARTIERESSQLAPLATIGRPRPVSGPKSQRVAMGWSGQFWRAATFALTGAVIVLAYFRAESQRDVAKIIDTLNNRETANHIQALIGDDFNDFVNNPNRTVKAMRPIDNDYPGIATLYLSKSDEVFLLGIGLPQTGESDPYTLSVIHKDGTLEQLKTFVSNGSVVGLRLDKISAAMLASATWQISNATGKVVLRTA
jgi:hypothetical protein